MTENRPIVDGFLYSASMLYLPTTYRASVLTQMDVLRRARGYRTRWYLVPVDLDNPISAFSQLEYQVRTQPGAYLWGVSFSAPFNDTESEDGDSQFIHVQITDSCTETPVFSDYTRGQTLEPRLAFTAQRYPMLLPTPRLVGDPGTLDIELYNRSEADIRCQLAILMAEPCVPPEEMRTVLEEAGLVEVAY